jgi:hypothetical protein
MKPARSSFAILPLALIAWLGLPGCGPDAMTTLRRENWALAERVAVAERRVADLAAEIAELQRQLQTARAIQPADLKSIYYPERIEIDTLSGGESYDGKPGDDGITLYVRPIDREGDVIKVAGEFRVELFDLDLPDNQRIGSYDFSLEQSAKLWRGKLMTNHYTLRCPWQSGPPKGAQITARVTFVDFLTRRALSAQTVCKHNSPAAAP